MATIAILFGIIIMLYPNDHNPPHVHVWYGEERAKFSIISGRMIAGSIPRSKAKIVKEFIQCYQVELLKMWNTKEYSMLKKTQ